MPLPMSNKIEKNRRRRKAIRYVSFGAAIISCLCAGSINVYSLYGHQFQERLKFTQMQVNMVSIAAELALYLPVSGFGYLCDRLGPAPLSFASAILFLIGYLFAAFTYNNTPKRLLSTRGVGDEAVWIMVIAFVLIGLATNMMYMSAVTTCAKNFGKSKHKGFAVASPIAAFGLSAFWQSQVGTRILYEHLPDGKRGDVDVFKFFLFLAIMLSMVGVAGAFLLRIVDNAEDCLDLEVAEEQSGLLGIRQNQSYGSTSDESTGSSEITETRQILNTKDDHGKTLTLHQVDNKFLKDHTMWWLAIGFLFVSGPGEAFITNLGTIIGTLNPPHADSSLLRTTAATQISVLAITSTISRILFGYLTDLLAPRPVSNSCNAMVEPISKSPSCFSFFFRFSVSRISFLIGTALLLSIGQILLAAGLIQNHAERFWAVSTFIGCGYGALFSLTPLIISVIWGVENFGTNWGIVAMVPALGTTLWSLMYSAVYQANAQNPTGSNKENDNLFCYGKACYSTTFWAMSFSVWAGCLSWLWAWKGKGGWTSRQIYI